MGTFCIHSLIRNWKCRLWFAFLYTVKLWIIGILKCSLLLVFCRARQVAAALQERPSCLAQEVRGHSGSPGVTEVKGYRLHIREPIRADITSSWTMIDTTMISLHACYLLLRISFSSVCTWCVTLSLWQIKCLCHCISLTPALTKVHTDVSLCTVCTVTMSIL